jgi:hypothetical protein
MQINILEKTMKHKIKHRPSSGLEQLRVNSVKTYGWVMLNPEKYTTVLIDIWPRSYQEICEFQEKTKFGNVTIRVLLQFPTSYVQFLLVDIPDLSCCKL